MARKNPWRNKKDRAAIMRGIQLAARKRSEARSLTTETADEIERLRDLEDAHEIIDAWKTKADQRADRIAEQQAEIERLQGHLAHREKEIARLEVEIVRLQAAHEANVGGLLEYEKRIIELMVENGRLRARIEQLEERGNMADD